MSRFIFCISKLFSQSIDLGQFHLLHALLMGFQLVIVTNNHTFHIRTQSFDLIRQKIYLHIHQGGLLCLSVILGQDLPLYLLHLLFANVLFKLLFCKLGAEDITFTHLARYEPPHFRLCSLCWVHAVYEPALGRDGTFNPSSSRRN